MPKKINIPKVTGNIIITASARSKSGITIPEGVNAINYMTYNKGISQTTAKIKNEIGCWATVDPITVISGTTYTLKMDATWGWVFSYDENDNFVSALSKGSNANPQSITFTANTTKIRFGCYDPNKKLTYCNLSKLTASNYLITKKLSNCTCSNTMSSVPKNGSYSTTITANSGYTLGSISVTMGGVNITSTAVSGNTINISNVTGDIIITAQATASSGSDTPSDTIGNMIYGKGVSQTTGVIKDNAECWATIDPITVVSGKTYRLSLDATWAWVISYNDSDGMVTLLSKGSNANPQDITFAADTTKIRYGCYDPNRKLTYCNLTEVTATETTYTVTKNLTKCTLSNNATSVTKGASYTSNVTANSGYELMNISITMGGRDITSSAFSGGKINIPNVTGNIVIIAQATASSPGGSGPGVLTYTITRNLTNCTSNNTSTNITKGASYTTTITANSGYKLGNITVTMGGSNISSTAVSGTTISISNVTGNIVISCIATATSSGGGGSDLTGTYVFFGDSICYGGGTSGYGYPQAIKAKQPAMTSLNYGVSGTCIARNTTYDVKYPSILSKIQKTATYADYIVLEGGVNDSWGNRNPIGTFKGGTAPTTSSAMISYGNSLNEYQFADALEKCIIEIKLKWWGKKIFYVIPHPINRTYSNPYFNLAIQICNKWGVIVIDLRNCGCTSADTVDGTHPTRAAYDNYYAPNIINVLKANK